MGQAVRLGHPRILDFRARPSQVAEVKICAELGCAKHWISRRLKVQK